jgi:hypothetical protein
LLEKSSSGTLNIERFDACKSTQLRRIFLAAQDLTLEKVQKIGRTYELAVMHSLYFATDAAGLRIMEEIGEFLGILYAKNVAEQGILLKSVKQNNRIKSI